MTSGELGSVHLADVMPKTQVMRTMALKEPVIALCLTEAVNNSDVTMCVYMM